MTNASIPGSLREPARPTRQEHRTRTQRREGGHHPLGPNIDEFVAEALKPAELREIEVHKEEKRIGLGC